MKNFNGINTKGIDIKQAIEVATRSEKSRKLFSYIKWINSWTFYWNVRK
jgi:hypothetical protein